MTVLALEIDPEALVDFIDLSDWGVRVWLATLALTFAFGLAMAAIHQLRRSPVDRLLRKRGRA
jgi:hypothetical protein